MNVEDPFYNRRSRERKRRSPHWRMRSPSDEGWDNITQPEQGPLGTGGRVGASEPHTAAGKLLGNGRGLRTE